jgi:serine/threonine protein kinase
MAEVYEAVDTRLGNRVVAIKTLLPNVVEHPFALKMRTLFIQEALALSRVKDDNVVDVLDFGTDPDGAPFMVMELLRGTDLGAVLKQRKCLAAHDAVDVILGVCAGVYACHLAGVIHRDLKPANIFLIRTQTGPQAKVLDFSVAKVPASGARTVSGECELTNTELIVGTPSYMSPEQAAGIAATELSDQYSIGALLYRCLVGRPPQRDLEGLCASRSEIPAGLMPLILRALDPTPDKRFATVHTFGHTLIEFASPMARIRWEPHFRAPARTFDPTTTKAITKALIGVARPVSSCESPSAAVTVTAPLYDFGAHERATVPVASLALAKNVDESASTTSIDLDLCVDAELGSIPGAALPATVESPLAATLQSREFAPPVVLRRSISGAASTRYGRGKVVVLFATAALLVVAGIVGAMWLRADRRAARAPAPPAWTRVTKVILAPKGTPLVPPPRSTLMPLPTPDMVVAPRIASVSEKALSTDRAASSPDERGGVRRQPKRRRHSKHASDRIQYGKDGVPILP